MVLRLALLTLIFLLAACTPAVSASYQSDNEIIGIATEYSVQHGDTLYDIARQNDLGIVAVMAANPGVDPWLPQEGQTLSLPTEHILPATPHEGIVINLAELRLFAYLPDGIIMSFPIGIGKEGWPTRTGITAIVRKRKNPVWIPPDSIRAETPDIPEIVPAGPDNPLGTHAMNLGWRGFVVHGTNRPYGVGRRSSHGCVRLYPEDIPVLFDSTALGTKVTVIDAPYKLAWRKNDLVLQVTPDQQQSVEIMDHGKAQSRLATDGIDSAIMNFAGKNVSIDWAEVRAAFENHTGLIVTIGHKTTLND